MAGAAKNTAAAQPAARNAAEMLMPSSLLRYLPPLIRAQRRPVARNRKVFCAAPTPCREPNARLRVAVSKPSAGNVGPWDYQASIESTPQNACDQPKRDRKSVV